MKKGNAVFVFLIGVLTTILIGLISFNAIDFALITKIKYDRLTEMEEKYGKVEKLKNDLIKKYYLDIDEDTIETGMYKGMFEATGDKYTIYMTEEELKEYNDSTNGNYVGIGILSDVSEENIEITRVFPNSPAEKAGIVRGDFVIEADGFRIDDVGYEELIDIMLGKAGTSIEIIVLRENRKIAFELKRDNVEVPSVSSDVINSIGYIYIYRFGTDTSKEFSNRLESLEKQNIEGLIIDVRDNPGGLVSESTKIADELMGKGMIVYTLDKSGRRNEYKSDRSKLDMPFIMISNENSASASEILLGAVQDSKTAEVVGVQSFGKGIVQGITNLRDGSGYKITFSQYFTPNDKNIHGIGIIPDYIVEYKGIVNGEEPNLKDDLQLLKAYEILEEKIISN